MKKEKLPYAMDPLLGFEVPAEPQGPPPRPGLAWSHRIHTTAK